MVLRCVGFNLHCVQETRYMSTPTDSGKRTVADSSTPRSANTRDMPRLAGVIAAHYDVISDLLHPHIAGELQWRATKHCNTKGTSTDNLNMMMMQG